MPFLPSPKWSTLLAVTWLIIMSILFVLPGSALPGNDWLNRIHFDKWVHIGLFAVLLWLWAGSRAPVTSGQMMGMFLLAVLYGLLVEIVQDQLVVHRSFDGWDLLADGVGSGLGLWVFNRTSRKK